MSSSDFFEEISTWNHGKRDHHEPRISKAIWVYIYIQTSRGVFSVIWVIYRKHIPTESETSLIQGTKALGFAFGWATIWWICVYSTEQCLVPGKHLHGKSWKSPCPSWSSLQVSTESLLGWFQSGGRKSRSFAKIAWNLGQSYFITCLRTPHVAGKLQMYVDIHVHDLMMVTWLHDDQIPSNIPSYHQQLGQKNRPQCQVESDSAKWPASCHAWNDLRDPSWIERHPRNTWAPGKNPNKLSTSFFKGTDTDSAYGPTFFSLKSQPWILGWFFSNLKPRYEKSPNWKEIVNWHLTDRYVADIDLAIPTNQLMRRQRHSWTWVWILWSSSLFAGIPE